jgi:membrane protein insertase Oxa1/YidC/SpoIIIJ
MRRANEINDKRDQPKPKSKKPRQEASQQRTKPKPKAKRSKKKHPKKQAKEELKQQQLNRRHTTNPSDSCLGRSLVIPNVRKAPT